MSSRENIALFDRYLQKEMDATENDAFEERLSHSESLRTELDEYITFSEEIKEGADYIHIRKDLAQIHADIYGKKKQKIIPLFRPKFLIPIGIAASIALLLYFNPFMIGADKQNADYAYEPLSNHSEGYAVEETNINDDSAGGPGYLNTEDSTNLIVSSIELNDSLLALKSLPSGTAFLISEDGFFLTSRHLIEGLDIVSLQQKETNLVFQAHVIYSDSLLDFAILQSSIGMALNFEAVPFEIAKEAPELGAEVFTLGYSKKEIVYTQGVVSSETGFESDSVYFEISLPSNAGNSGAPLFDENGALVGIVTAQNSKKQAVTYVLKQAYIESCLADQSERFDIDMSTNYSRKRLEKKRRIKLYRPFIFEVHGTIQ